MIPPRRFSLSIFVLMSLSYMPSIALAGDPATPRLESWVVYWDLPHSLDDATRLSSQLSGVGAFCYRFAADGSLVPGSPALDQTIPKLTALSSTPGFTVWISVTNDVIRNKKTIMKDASIVHDMLSKPSRRVAHIQALLAVAGPVDTLEIDYENLWAKDHDAYSGFISELAQALHAQSKHLIVVVQPKTNDRVRDEAGAIDWAAVAKSADVGKIMGYHFHYASGPPGPIAPPSWIADLTRFALERIPPEKLSVVLTLSGFDWSDHGPAKSIDYAAAMQKANTLGIRVEQDPVTGSPHYAYNENNTHHVVWFEDAESLKRKMETLESFGISRIGFWRLGTGDPLFWSKTSPPR